LSFPGYVLHDHLKKVMRCQLNSAKTIFARLVLRQPSSGDIMQIQLNSDNRITGSQELLARVQANLEEELKHVTSVITRVEVHLNDVNGAKGGEDDKRCMLEARLSGLQPMAVESRAPTIDQAVSAAAGQLHRAIKTSLGKAEATERSRDSIRRSNPEDLGT
jgi:hypothetical protein